MILIFIGYIASIMGVVICHEVIHWIFAKWFHRHPKIEFYQFITPVVTYKNNDNDLQNLIISASAPIILTILGILIDGNTGTIFIKIMCLFNAFNLLPIATDGEVILLSVINLLRKE